MRKLISCLFAGAALVLVMNVVAGPGLAFMAWPAAAGSAMPQVVDRTHKSDRLRMPTANDRRWTPPSAPGVLIGCEPVFSALSSGTHVNVPGRCVAGQKVAEVSIG